MYKIIFIHSKQKNNGLDLTFELSIAVATTGMDGSTRQLILPSLKAMSKNFFEVIYDFCLHVEFYFQIPCEMMRKVQGSRSKKELPNQWIIIDQPSNLNLTLKETKSILG